jgi:hypothetical protein
MCSCARAANTCSSAFQHRDECGLTWLMPQQGAGGCRPLKPNAALVSSRPNAESAKTKHEQTQLLYLLWAWPKGATWVYRSPTTDHAPGFVPCPILLPVIAVPLA